MNGNRHRWSENEFSNESLRIYFKKNPDKLPPTLQLKLWKLTGATELTDDNILILFPVEND